MTTTPHSATPRPLAIYGAGGLGREIAVMVEQINRAEETWVVTGFYDDGLTAGHEVDGLPVLGGMKEANAVTEYTSLVVAIAHPHTRKNVVERITNDRIHFPIIVHPQAICGGETNYFGKGTIITAGCILTTGIVLGEFTIINLASTLGHDVKLGSFSIVMPGSNISGNVQVGECTMIGTGARILQNITLGKNCQVGAGCVVTKSFGDGVTVVGVPGAPVASKR
jgi:sugar O-acyltransferase (sialic acid O-acetyltransferase NeuD family)